VHGGFFKKDGQLIDDAHIIADIPAVIVQGRYDLVCPMKVRAHLTPSRLLLAPDATKPSRLPV